MSRWTKGLVTRYAVKKTGTVVTKTTRSGYQRTRSAIKSGLSGGNESQGQEADAIQSSKDILNHPKRGLQSAANKAKERAKNYSYKKLGKQLDATRGRAAGGRSASKKALQVTVRKTSKYISTPVRSTSKYITGNAPSAMSLPKSKLPNTTLLRRNKVASKASQSAAKAGVQGVQKLAAAIAKASAQVAKLAAQATAKLIAAAGIPGLIVILLVIVVVLCGVAILNFTPVGMFFFGSSSGTVEPNTYTVAQVKATLESELQQKISSASGNDATVIVKRNDEDGISNWKDIFALYDVLALRSNPDFSNFDSDDLALIRTIFFKMNIVTTTVSEVDSPSPAPTSAATGSTSTPAAEETTTVITIDVVSLVAQDMYGVFSMSQEEITSLTDLLTADPSMWAEFLGVSAYQIPQTADLTNVLDAISNPKGKQIVEAAMSKLGWNYSKELAGNTTGYADCSWLVQNCYKGIGIDLPRCSWEQAQWCIDNGKTISKSQLQPGDLIFWSLKTNGNTLNVSHVGIYVGGGSVIDASSSSNAVVFRADWGAQKQVLFAHVF